MTKLKQVLNPTRIPQIIRNLVHQSIKAICILERKVILIEIQARVIFPRLKCLLHRLVSCNSTYLDLTPCDQYILSVLVGNAVYEMFVVICRSMEHVSNVFSKMFPLKPEVALYKHLTRLVFIVDNKCIGVMYSCTKRLKLYTFLFGKL